MQISLTKNVEVLRVMFALQESRLGSNNTAFWILKNAHPTFPVAIQPAIQNGLHVSSLAATRLKLEVAICGLKTLLAPHCDNLIAEAIDAICALMVETNTAKHASRRLGFAADVTGKPAMR